jgi:hypothetical protein
VVSFSIVLMVWGPVCASTLGMRKGRAVAQVPLIQGYGNLRRRHAHLSRL